MGFSPSEVCVTVYRWIFDLFFSLIDCLPAVFCCLYVLHVIHCASLTSEWTRRTRRPPTAWSCAKVSTSAGSHLPLSCLLLLLLCLLIPFVFLLLHFDSHCSESRGRLSPEGRAMLRIICITTMIYACRCIWFLSCGVQCLMSYMV